jgi:hypothetical protein
MYTLIQLVHFGIQKKFGFHKRDTFLEQLTDYRYFKKDPESMS